MLSSNSPEFCYSVVNSKLEPQEPSQGEYTPKTGDFSVRMPQVIFKSGYPVELEGLSFEEKKAYDLRWQMKGHPSLYFMIGRILGSDVEEAREKMQDISLKVRYYKRLGLN